MKTTIWSILGFVWNKRELILAAIPLIFEAQRTMQTNSEKKAFVAEELAEVIKGFTSDEIDKVIDFVVQLLQAMNVLK